MKKVAFAIIIFMAVALICFYVFEGKNQNSDDYDSYVVEERSINDAIYLMGMVEKSHAVQMVNDYRELKIEKICVSEGEYIRKNADLYVYDKDFILMCIEDLEKSIDYSSDACEAEVIEKYSKLNSKDKAIYIDRLKELVQNPYVTAQASGIVTGIDGSKTDICLTIDAVEITDDIRISAYVDDGLIKQIDKGADVTYTVDDETSGRAKVTEISSYKYEEGYRVDIEYVTMDKWNIGQQVLLRIIEYENETALCVPYDYVYEDEGGSFVRDSDGEKIYLANMVDCGYFIDVTSGELTVGDTIIKIN